MCVGNAVQAAFDDTFTSISGLCNSDKSKKTVTYLQAMWIRWIECLREIGDEEEGVAGKSKNRRVRMAEGRATSYLSPAKSLKEEEG
ncbi:hypothetical protein DKX38_003826 [Salix brachista]|uniref:Uncharacterized protein n=1 Tax=Salix brachista TaxID=2182728 RepID=A0A5N5N9I8_9ROSI|nr:hypothetical protein DKX38_003826 [Salix brachista]